MVPALRRRPLPPSSPELRFKRDSTLNPSLVRAISCDRAVTGVSLHHLSLSDRYPYLILRLASHLSDIDIRLPCVIPLVLYTITLRWTCSTLLFGVGVDVFYTHLLQRVC